MSDELRLGTLGDEEANLRLGTLGDEASSNLRLGTLGDQAPVLNGGPSIPIGDPFVSSELGRITIRKQPRQRPIHQRKRLHHHLENVRRKRPSPFHPVFERCAKQIGVADGEIQVAGRKGCKIGAGVGRAD